MAEEKKKSPEAPQESFGHTMLIHCLVVVNAFLALGFLATLALNLSFLNPVAQIMKGFSVTDIYYHVLNDYGKADTSHVVTIVDMTDIPDRYLMAEVLDSIEAMNPRVVGLDIVFQDPKDEMGDNRIIQSAKAYDNTVFSYWLQDWVNDSVGYSGEVHSFFTDSIRVTEGFTNYERMLYGGLKRTANLQRNVMAEPRTAFVYEVVQRYTGGQLALKENTDLTINFSPTVFRVVNYDSISYYRDLIEDHIVLFGAAHELADMHYTPIGKMAGVELLAYTIQTILNQTEVRTPSLLVTIVLTFLLVLITRMGRQAYLKWARSFSNEFVAFFLTTTFVIGSLLFVWTAILMGGAFILFTMTSININLGWTLAAIPFLYGANEFALMIVNYLKHRRNKLKQEMADRQEAPHTHDSAENQQEVSAAESEPIETPPAMPEESLS